MEHLLLGRVPAGDELYVVHEEHVGPPVFFPKFGVAPLPNGLDQFIGEGISLDVDNFVIRVVFMDGVGDGVQKVGLAQAGLAVDKQWVITLSRIVGHRPGGGVSKFVGGAHHEALEGVLLGAGEEVVFFRLLLILIQFSLGKNSHLHITGEQVPQGGLDFGDIAGGDDVPLEAGGGVEDEAVILQRHGGGVVKPGIDGGGGHVGLHQADHLGPYICGRIHGKENLLE